MIKILFLIVILVGLVIVQKTIETDQGMSVSGHGQGQK